MAKVTQKVLNKCDGCGSVFDALDDVAPATIVQGTMPPQPRPGLLCRSCWVSTGQPRPFEDAVALRIARG